MADRPNHLSKENAPDPSNAYERSHPEAESGMGRLDNNTRATPTPAADHMPHAVKHAQDGAKQLNAHDDLHLEQSPAKQRKDTGDQDETTGWNTRPTTEKKPKK